LKGDDGSWSVQELLRFADRVHALGANFDLQNWGYSQYGLAAYFLISNGNDNLGDSSVTPNNWHPEYDVDLGDPQGPRYLWNNLLRRDFENGIVLMNPPGKATVTASLGDSFQKQDGTTVTSVSLAGRQGLILLRTTDSNITTPPAVNDDVCGSGTGSFSGDQYSDGGHCDSFTSTVNLTNVGDVAPQEVYQTKRTTNSGDTGFSYNVENLDSSHAYHVQLHFADDVSAVIGKRTFNVYINGTKVLNTFDIFAAGGRTRAVVKSFFGIHPNSSGVISVRFENVVGNALSSAVSVLP
jgi:hypothetical protein